MEKLDFSKEKMFFVFFVKQSMHGHEEFGCSYVLFHQPFIYSISDTRFMQNFFIQKTFLSPILYWRKKEISFFFLVLMISMHLLRISNI